MKYTFCVNNKVRAEQSRQALNSNCLEGAKGTVDEHNDVDDDDDDGTMKVLHGA